MEVIINLETTVLIFICLTNNCAVKSITLIRNKCKY